MPSLALAASGVIAVLLLGLSFLFAELRTTDKELARAELTAAMSENSRQYENQIATLTAASAAALEGERSAFRTETERLTNELDLTRNNVEKIALGDPYGFGADFHKQLAIGMCLTELGQNQSDRAAREACHLRADALDPAGNTFTLTITAKTAAYLAQACEAWKSIGEEDAYDLEQFYVEFPTLEDGADACNYSITGFTPQGVVSFKIYQMRDEDYKRGLNRDIDVRDQAIENIKNGPPKE